MTNGSLMKVKSIAECSLWSILQYFWPALSNNRSWKPIFVFFLSGHLRQVLLYQNFVRYISFTQFQLHVPYPPIIILLRKGVIDYDNDDYSDL